MVVDHSRLGPEGTRRWAGTVTSVKIAYGSDDRTAATDDLAAHLGALGHEVLDVAVGASWVDAGHLVAEAVVDGRADLGIVWCFTGTGVAIAANKVVGCRAALCADAETATGARRWNDANVLALSLRTSTATRGIEIAEAFLAAHPDDDTAASVANLEPDVR